MCTAGIVANHPTEGTVIMCGRIGSKGEMVLFSSMAQVIENGPRLHPRYLFLWVDLEHAIHVFRHIDDNSDVARLSGETGTTTAQNERRTIATTGRYRCDHIVYVFGN